MLTLQDLLTFFPERELIELSNLDDATADTVDIDRVEGAIARASQEINSYLGVRFTLPIEGEIPMVLQSKAADVIRYYLDVYRVRDDVAARYKEAIAWLRLLAKGEVTLGIDSDIAPPDQSRRITVTSHPPIFNRDTLNGL